MNSTWIFGSETSSQIITFSSRFAERRLNLKVTPRFNQLQPIEDKWRKRVGVEPTSDRKTCHPPVLKTGMITGPRALPCR